MTPNSYVYCYLDPRKSGVWKTSTFTFFFEPFYIGEGKNNRMFDHLKDSNRNRKACKIRKIIKDGFYPIIIVISDYLLPDEAKKKESYLIREIGTIETLESAPRGPLTNARLNDDTKWVFSVEARKRLSDSCKGRKLSDEHKLKLSRIMTGTKQTPEQIEKRSKAWIGRKHKDESKMKISIANSDKKRSDDVKLRMSIISKTRESIPWIVKYPDGKIETIDILTEWCKFNCVNYKSLRNTLHTLKPLRTGYQLFRFASI